MCSCRIYNSLYTHILHQHTYITSISAIDFTLNIYLINANTNEYNFVFIYDSKVKVF